MEIRKIGCVGAGTIGHSWATLFAMKGMPVKLHDVNEEILEGALTRIKANLTFLAEKKIIGKSEIESIFERIKPTTSLSEAVKDVDYVQESAAENYEVKKDLFGQMDAESQPKTILASSSSFLLMSEIQRNTVKPGRCLIAHPFNPPHLVPLVELVPGEQTSSETISTTYEFMLKMGKVPVALKKEVPGHIGNRLSFRLYEEVVKLVDEEIATVEDIDRAVFAGPGIRWALMGPNLTYHMGGGPGGLESAFKWAMPVVRSFGFEFSDSGLEKVIQGIKDMKQVQTKTMEELVKWRDDKLVELLKILN